MPKTMHPWIKEMDNAEFHYHESDPHHSNRCLQNYLSYYSFDITAFSHYRCGTVKSGNRKLFIQSFIRKESKGMIMFVHGYLDHTGGMSRTVNMLLNEGYSVSAVDLPGHGFSQGESGAIASFDEYIEAVSRSYELIKRHSADEKITGLGHSTGGAILFQAVSEKRISLNSLMLAAPLYFPYRWTIFKGMIKLSGKFISKSRRRFKKNSDDARYQLFIKNDPLQVRWLKSDWLKAMEAWQQRIVNCSIINIPVYLLQGDKDTTVDWKRNVKFYEQKCRYIQIAFFKNGRHQLLNEKKETRTLVYERIKSFLDNA